MADRFQPNPTFTAQLQRSAKVGAFLRAVAETGANKAEQAAKAEAYDASHQGVHYADSFEAGLAQTPLGIVGRVSNTDWKAGILEVHGTQNGRGRAILRRSAESLSIRFIQGGRS